MNLAQMQAQGYAPPCPTAQEMLRMMKERHAKLTSELARVQELRDELNLLTRMIDAAESVR